MPIRITVELIPGGNEARKKVLGVMAIDRVSEVSVKDTGDYRVIEMQSEELPEMKAYIVKNIQHPREDNVFKFIRNLLKT